MTAILIEVTSIQQYIFSSNKLKENIGASFIIENKLFAKSGLLDEILKNEFGVVFDINNWKDGNPINNNAKCEIGYGGGGNTLIFFKDYDDAINVIEKFSISALKFFPSLKLNFGIKKDFNLTKYKSEFQELLKDLKKRKAENYIITNYPKSGITADCPLSNENAEFLLDEKFISIVSKTKLLAAEELKNFEKNKMSILFQNYEIPDEIDKMGQPKEGSYIAVVHVDGNGMGRIFSEIETIEELRKKSALVSKKVKSAMDQLINHLIYLKTMEWFCEKYPGKLLPIRPIVVGGDDVTFICEGRLGVYLAEKFIEYYFDENERNKGIENKERLMDGACAGVAIVKSHFPIYKSVKLAEELCGEAKKQSRENPGSYLSFYYSSTTFSGELKELRKKTHRFNDSSLYYGPYKLFEEDKIISIEKLKTCIYQFKTKWPRNKVMVLRKTITGSDSLQKLFENEIEQIGLKLPLDWNKIWSNKETPFFDAIELMDFYFDELLKTDKHENYN